MQETFQKGVRNVPGRSHQRVDQVNRYQENRSFSIERAYQDDNKKGPKLFCIDEIEPSREKREAKYVIGIEEVHLDQYHVAPEGDIKEHRIHKKAEGPIWGYSVIKFQRKKSGQADRNET